MRAVRFEECNFYQKGFKFWFGKGNNEKSEMELLINKNKSHALPVDIKGTGSGSRW